MRRPYIRRGNRPNFLVSLSHPLSDTNRASALAPVRLDLWGLVKAQQTLLDTERKLVTREAIPSNLTKTCLKEVCESISPVSESKMSSIKSPASRRRDSIYWLLKIKRMSSLLNRFAWDIPAALNSQCIGLFLEQDEFFPAEQGVRTTTEHPVEDFWICDDSPSPKFEHFAGRMCLENNSSVFGGVSWPGDLELGESWSRTDSRLPINDASRTDKRSIDKIL